MRTIKTYARPCGDCWTDVRRESLIYRFGVYADEMYARTGRGMWSKAASVPLWLARIDADAAFALFAFALVCFAAGFMACMWCTYGGRLADVLWALVGTVKAYAPGGDGDGILYMLGLM